MRIKAEKINPYRLPVSVGMNFTVKTCINMSDSLTSPSLSLLVKLGSIVVHADEFTGRNGYEYDLVAMRQGLVDPEVTEWLEEMQRRGFLPVKRI